MGKLDIGFMSGFAPIVGFMSGFAPILGFRVDFNVQGVSSREIKVDVDLVDVRPSWSARIQAG